MRLCTYTMASLFKSGEGGEYVRRWADKMVVDEKKQWFRSSYLYHIVPGFAKKKAKSLLC